MLNILPVYFGYGYFHINKISYYLSKKRCQCSAVQFRFLQIQLYCRLESLTVPLLFNLPCMQNLYAYQLFLFHNALSLFFHSCICSILIYHPDFCTGRVCVKPFASLTNLNMIELFLQVCRKIDGCPHGTSILERIFEGVSVYYNYTGGVDCFQLDDDPHGMDGWNWQVQSFVVLSTYQKKKKKSFVVLSYVIVLS